MRTQSKIFAKPGHSKAAMYRSNVFSVASDIEAMVDAYGVEAITKYAQLIHDQLAEHGDCLHNGLYNHELNNLPLPRIRKQNKIKAKRIKQNPHHRKAA
mgnify:CR=1 FL=1